MCFFYISNPNNTISVHSKGNILEVLKQSNGLHFIEWHMQALCDLWLTISCALQNLHKNLLFDGLMVTVHKAHCSRLSRVKVVQLVHLTPNPKYMLFWNIWLSDSYCCSSCDSSLPVYRCLGIQSTLVCAKITILQYWRSLWSICCLIWSSCRIQEAKPHLWCQSPVPWMLTTQPDRLWWHKNTSYNTKKRCCQRP